MTPLSRGADCLETMAAHRINRARTNAGTRLGLRANLGEAFLPRSGAEHGVPPSFIGTVTGSAVPEDLTSLVGSRRIIIGITAIYCDRMVGQCQIEDAKEHARDIVVQNALLSERTEFRSQVLPPQAPTRTGNGS